MSSSPDDAADLSDCPEESALPTTILRSSHWFSGADLSGILHRATIRASGISRAALTDRPVIGICNSWSELVHCNMNLRAVSDAVKRGVLQAGGLPLEFPTISLSENLMKPTAMLYRNLMAMDVEESIRAHPFDAVVLLGGCDKTTPAQLMGAASADVPAISVSAGPANPGSHEGRALGTGTDLWRGADDLRAGRIDATAFAAFESALMPSVGHCNEMGTASTMAALTEALGMSLPGSAAIPATDARRAVAAELAGRRAVELARERLRPSQILTAAAFHNAVTTLMALGGSTNAVIHLLALAGRCGVDLTLADFDTHSARTPLLVNLRPSGAHLLGDLFRAGGVPALLNELRPLLNESAVTVTGNRLVDDVAGAAILDRDVIAPLDQPFQTAGALAVLTGNLAPHGAVIKRSAATPALLRHRGPAVVFDGIGDLLHRIEDPDLPVTEQSVLVLRGVGPKGVPGMPEWGQLPIPERLLRRGVRDLVRISDARMSGTAYGTVVLHVAPEAAAGGPLAVVRDGDPILLDVDRRTLRLDITDGELSERLARLPAPPPDRRRGWSALYAAHVLGADQGCDLDFLRGRDVAQADRLPAGLVHGWLGGW